MPTERGGCEGGEGLGIDAGEIASNTRFHHGRSAMAAPLNSPAEAGRRGKTRSGGFRRGNVATLSSVP